MSNLPSRCSAKRFLLAATFALGAGSLAFWYRRPIATWQAPAKGGAQASQITRFLPKAEFAGEVSVVVHAPAEAIYVAIQKVTLADMPIANLLGNLRYLPSKLLGQPAPQVAPDAAAMPFLELIQANGSNLLLLANPNRELIVGAIGKFHNLLDQQFVTPISLDAFVAFNEPEYQKLAMSFLLTPLPAGSGYRLSLIHGTHGLSAAASRKFAFYWLGIKPGGNFVSWLMLRAIRTLAEHETNPLPIEVKT